MTKTWRSPRRDRHPSTSRDRLPTMKLPRQARAVIFDMDGLMFNTETLYRDAVVAAAAEAGHDLPLPFYLSTIGMSIEATRTAFGERYGKQFDFDGFWAAASTQYSGIVELQLCLKAGVVELLDFLDGTSLPRAIATSSRHEDVQRNLGAQGLRDRFQTVIARGDYARGKPHPEPFLKAAERLGVAIDPLFNNLAGLDAKFIDAAPVKPRTVDDTGGLPFDNDHVATRGPVEQLPDEIRRGRGLHLHQTIELASRNGSADQRGVQQTFRMPQLNEGLTIPRRPCRGKPRYKILNLCIRHRSSPCCVRGDARDIVGIRLAIYGPDNLVCWREAVVPAKNNSSSPRRRGPITTDLSCYIELPLQLCKIDTPGVMGPRLRGDDDGVCLAWRILNHATLKLRVLMRLSTPRLRVAAAIACARVRRHSRSASRRRRSRDDRARRR